MSDQQWEVTVPPGQEGAILYKWLRGRQEMSRRFLKRLKTDGQVLVNGQEMYWNMRVQSGDVITVKWQEPMKLRNYSADTGAPDAADEAADDNGFPVTVGYLSEPYPPGTVLDDLDPRCQMALAWADRICILDEDEDLLAAYKPPYVLVHPFKKERGRTLLDYCQRMRPDARLRPVHRIDRETSGVVLFSKHAMAHKRLSDQFMNRTTKKSYLAWVHGECRAPAGEAETGDTFRIDGPIRHDPDHKVRRIVVPADGSELIDGSGVFTAETIVRPIRRQYCAQTAQWFSEVEVHPLTGRTHQIRVHLAHVGFPLAGDPLYGGHLIDGRAERVMLHAASLTALHPRTGELKTWTSPMPEDWFV